MLLRDSVTMEPGVSTDLILEMRVPSFLVMAEAKAMMDLPPGQWMAPSAVSFCPPVPERCV